MTPRRKLFYGLIAFGPGTILGLYLQSVKNHMEKENEELRLKHVNEELAEERARDEKDQVLVRAIEDLRTRIQLLEREHLANNQTSPSSNLKSTNSIIEKPLENSSLLSSIKQWQTHQEASLQHMKNLNRFASGINDRIRAKEQERIAEDVRMYKTTK